MKLVLAATIALACSRAPAATPHERIEQVTVRDHATVSLIVDAPEHPRAIVLLFPGGDGELGLVDGKPTKAADNFVVRARQLFVDAGFVAIVVDSPSDHRKLQEFRATAEHARDVDAVIAWATGQWKLPVFLVGTSRGTISAANAASRGAKVAGLVLTAAITAGDEDKVTLLDVPLADLKAPTFVLSHVADACKAAPPDGAHHLATALGARWLTVSGGTSPADKPCAARTHHGFYGVEAETVSAIVKFLYYAENAKGPARGLPSPGRDQSN